MQLFILFISGVVGKVQFSREKDKGNTNTKTPIKCEKCVSHPYSMPGKKMLFQKIKNIFFCHISTGTSTHKRMCVFGRYVPDMC